MRKCAITLFAITAAAASAGARPLGLSGLSVGIGAGGLTEGFIQGEYDFMLSQYVCLGPELMVGFGGGGAIYGGAAGRFYVIPDLHPIFQPHIAFGLGLAHRFEKEGDRGEGVESATGAYIDFAFGCDFDIPRSPVSPYLDLGGLFFVGSDSDASFKIEVGIRFAI
ncbi:MAG: hypothetical protein GTN49_00845 [candidate division Zixibacteria bacterium]|nr:hypothetical protein [candidate division Zixibacteria bacterium]